MDDDRSLSEAESESECVTADRQGVLSKWTNYIHGWQERFIVLKNNTLSYYKNEEESGLGCRGAISLYKAAVRSHELDDCRFDVSVNDCVWYLRASSPKEKQLWVDALELCKRESGYGTGSESSLKRHGSALSLQSSTLSSASNGGGVALKEKIAELGTFRDILCKQVDSLQRYFDDCVGRDFKSKTLTAIDFRGEAITFKTTTSGVLNTLDHCLELMTQREDSWKKRLIHEMERRKKAEHLAQQYKVRLNMMNNLHPGPDLEEGPHSVLPEDVFYDAVESSLEKLDLESQTRERCRTLTSSTESKNETAAKERKICATQENATKNGVINHTSIASDPLKCHRLWPEIQKVCKEQLDYALQGISNDQGGWQLFAEEGEMKMYRREEEINGMVVDPLKACHIVKGITGHELCHYFFRPEFRYDWETTLEEMKILETVSDDTIIFLQTHKRIWPATQRDALFWSHLGSVQNPSDSDGQDIWYVCNRSTEYPDNVQANNTKCIRVFITVCLVCQTLIKPPKDSNTPLTRDDISCKITYCSTINPGGWAPASVLRSIYKKEYPKFLKRFTAYVVNKRAGQSIMF